QGLIKSGLIDFGRINPSEVRTIITDNLADGFVSSLVDVKVSNNMSPWMSGMEKGHIYTVPLATYEGRIVLPQASNIIRDQIATEFMGPNITGSELRIDSLTCRTGRVFGCLTGIDRMDEGLYKNVELKGVHNIFESGIKYFQ
ncbi:MAG: phosphoribosylformylglycinamidine synthase subunit PurQ, partial [Tissierellaceae bacterium]